MAQSNAATDVEQTQPEAAAGDDQWASLRERLGTDVTPDAIDEYIARRERELESGFTKRFQEVADLKRELQSDRERLGQLEQRVQHQPQAKADPTEFYRLLGVEDPDEPLTARQLYNQQSFFGKWLRGTAERINQTFANFDERLGATERQAREAHAGFGGLMVAEQVSGVLGKYEHADLDKVLDVITTVEDPEQLDREIERVARETHRDFQSRATKLAEGQAKRRRTAQPTQRGAATPVAGEHPYRGKDGRVDWGEFADQTFPGDVDEPL